ncbi:MAG: C-GCAxxG-C-C family protein [Thermodesulfobacteriota bacterium]
MAVGQEKAKLIDETVIKAMGAYGGGIAASGGTCGTLLGGVALISGIYSRASLTEKEDPRMWSLSKKFIAAFEELTRECGGTDCRDIARVDWSDKAAAKEYYASPDSRRQVCIELVGAAAHALGEILEAEGF